LVCYNKLKNKMLNILSYLLNILTIAIFFNVLVFIDVAKANTWLDGWDYRKQITIDHSNVDSNLIDFPLLVKITADENLSSALSTGADIRFTSSDGLTLLKYERESWTGGDGSSVTTNIWVKVPTILSSVNTVIYMYYGKADAEDGQDANNAWDSNYKAVWHLKEATGVNNTDSTINNNTGTPRNGPTQIIGKIAGSLNFPRTTNVDVQVANSTSFNNLATSTFSFWANPITNSGPEMDIFMKKTTWNSSGFRLNWNGHWSFWGGGGNESTFTDTLSFGEWHYYSFTADGTNVLGYKDSLPLVRTASITSAISQITAPLYLGSYIGENPFNGQLDEMRISASTRSADWIKFEYNNMNSANNELTFASQTNYINTVMATTDSNGTISPSGAVGANYEANQTFTIIPNTSYKVSDVLVDGVSQGAISSYTFTNVTTDHTISVIFELATSSSGGGRLQTPAPLTIPTISQSTSTTIAEIQTQISEIKQQLVSLITQVIQLLTLQIQQAR